MQHAPSVVRQDNQEVNTRKVAVETVRKSIETISRK